jgi:ribulose-phosphate 3-epimerase
MRPLPRLAADLSLWSADLGRLEEEVRGAEPHADSFHFDVADAHFVPSLLFFPEVVARLRTVTQAQFHVHLMVERPDLLCEPFLEAGADWVTVHVECASYLREAHEKVRKADRQFGLAVMLETPLLDLASWLPVADSVLLLGTPAGVKGRGLADAALERIEKVKAMARDKMVIADGGIRQFTVPQLRAAGADMIVPGSLYFQAPDRAAAAAWWRSF